MKRTTCPSCRSIEVFDPFYIEPFACGSNTLGNGLLNQSNHCMEAERNQLLARVKRLEDAGDAMAHYMAEGPYAKDRIAQAGERALRISVWKKAKEDKP